MIAGLQGGGGAARAGLFNATQQASDSTQGEVELTCDVRDRGAVAGHAFEGQPEMEVGGTWHPSRLQRGRGNQLAELYQVADQRETSCPDFAQNIVSRDRASPSRITEKGTAVKMERAARERTV
jgi:hypothetical protein